MIKNFYDLDAWKKAHELALMIYEMTKKFPKEEIFGITSQLRRAASSVTANIAEGFERYHFADKIRFYYQARGSVSEIQSFTFLARDLSYVNAEKSEAIHEMADQVRKLINGTIRSIEKQDKRNE